MNNKTSLTRELLSNALPNTASAKQKELLIRIHTEGITEGYRNNVHLCREIKNTFGFRILGYEYTIQILVDSDLNFTMAYSGSIKMNPAEASKILELLESVQSVVNNYLHSYGSEIKVSLPTEVSVSVF